MYLPLQPFKSRLLTPPLLLPVVLGLSVLLGFLSGCKTSTGSTTPPTALQTFASLYADAVTADTLAVSSTTTALQAGLISAPQAQAVLNATDAIKAVLDAANVAAQAGNAATANANLGQAMASVAVLSACLTAKPLTVTTFATCIQRLTVPAVQS